MPLVSVIVPVYNLENIVSKCIDSILKQTMPDFELILVNDGSCDCSGSILDHYKDADNRVRVIHQQNAGPGAAYNAGLKIATGSYIYILDGDNYIDIDFLERMYTMSSQSNADVVSCDYYLEQYRGPGTYEEIGELRFGQTLICNNRTEVASVFSDLYEKLLLQSPCNKLYKRKVIETVFFDEDRSRMLVVDADFNLRVFFQIETIAILNRKMCHYVQYDKEREQITSLWRKKYTTNMLECQLRCFRLAEEYIKNYYGEGMGKCHSVFFREILPVIKVLLFDECLTKEEKQREYQKYVVDMERLLEKIGIMNFYFFIMAQLLQKQWFAGVKIIFQCKGWVKTNLRFAFMILKRNLAN